MLRRAICEAPKLGAVKQVRALAAPAAEPAVGSAPLESAGGDAIRVEVGKVGGETARATARVSNYFKGREMSFKPAPKDVKEPVRQGVLQNLFY